MPPAGYDYRTSGVDEDRRRAQEVYERVERNARQAEQAGDGARGGEGQTANGAGDDKTDEEKQAEAIRRIQGGYRDHVKRREGLGCNLGCSKRWDDGLRQRRLSSAGHEQNEGQNDAASRWQRGQVFASKISEGGGAGSSDRPADPSAEDEKERLGRNPKEKAKIEKERKQAKQMEAQYWLEMVDKKHRYGTNLKWYHQRWNETETNDNFFHWLDEGEGKDLDLEQCPRNQLESERIKYLNAEEREVYRVKVNEAGLLVWAKDGTLLDTSKLHEDRGPDKGGIVAVTEEEYEEKRRKEEEKLRKMQAEGKKVNMSSSSSSSSSSSDEADEIREGVRAYGDKGGTAGQGKGVRQAKERVRYYVSPRHLGDRLLRKTINKNTFLAFHDRWFCHAGTRRWLYVSDLNNNLYVGIKKTGSFQHSSFLYGARVTSAGLLKAQKGHLTSLSPLSGHYRAGTMHFKAFVRSLVAEGVDMSKVSISKSVMTIRGIEKYGKFTKQRKALKEKVKSALTGSKPEDEEEDEEECAEAQHIQHEEREEGQENGDTAPRCHQRKAEEPLPAEGKDIGEMTDDERLERGLALIQRAFEQGLRVHSKEADPETR